MEESRVELWGGNIRGGNLRKPFGDPSYHLETITKSRNEVKEVVCLKKIPAPFFIVVFISISYFKFFFQ